MLKLVFENIRHVRHHNLYYRIKKLKKVKKNPHQVNYKKKVIVLQTKDTQSLKVCETYSDLTILTKVIKTFI